MRRWRLGLRGMGRERERLEEGLVRKPYCISFLIRSVQTPTPPKKKSFAATTSVIKVVPDHKL